MLVTDPALAGWYTGMGIQYNDGKPTLGELKLALIAGAIGAVIVVVWGLWLAKRQEAAAKSAAPSEKAEAGNS
jgi:type VI protein secretion system component VasK